MKTQYCRCWSTHLTSDLLSKSPLPNDYCLLSIQRSLLDEVDKDYLLTFNNHHENRQILLAMMFSIRRLIKTSGI